MIRQLFLLLVFLFLYSETEVFAANLLTNSGFDTDIAGWSITGNCSAGWDSFGPNNADGALAVNCFNPSMAGRVAQCVSVSPDDIDFSAQLAGNGKRGPVSFGLSSYATDNCTGPATVVLDPSGTSVIPASDCCGTPWTDFSRKNISLPVATRSVMVEMTITSPADIALDNIRLSQIKSVGAPIGPSTSGVWYNVDQSGSGFLVEILPDNMFLAVWFVFTPDGTAQNWIYLQGPYDPTSNTITISDALLEQGGSFPPKFDASKITRTHWGSVSFTFSGCNEGSVTWNSIVPGYGNGNMKLTRLSNLAGLSCN
jgi:hypothetical protein